MDQDALFDALHDDVSRSILEFTAENERTVEELADLIDVSESTIYRHVGRLSEHDLLAEGLELDEAGHHRRVYRTAISHIEIDIEEEAIRTRVEWREDMADRFTRIWEELRRES